MALPISAYLGLRYWRSRKSSAFTSFVSLFSVSGIVLGVSALIIVSSVMNGLENQLKSRILTAVPQLVAEPNDDVPLSSAPLEALAAIEGVEGVTPQVSSQVMLSSNRSLEALMLNGLFPLHPQTKLMNEKMLYGGMEALVAGSYGIVIGNSLSDKLGLNIGDKVRVISAKGIRYTAIGPQPPQRNFTVVGIFYMGSEVDGQLAFAHYDDVAKLTANAPELLSELRFYLTDAFQSSEVAQSASAILGSGYQLHDWRGQYGQLFDAVKMEKLMMNIMLCLIMLVAAFNIVSALVMMVVDKSADIAILKTQGLTSLNCMTIFIIQGMLNAVIGLFIGLFIGIMITLNLADIFALLGVSLLGPGMALPISISAPQVGLLIVGTLLITLLSTLYPAYRAAAVSPSEVLRYE